VVSSRRRHTRSKRDWSSDVCSSDLHALIRQTQRSTLKQVPSFAMHEGKRDRHYPQKLPSRAPASVDGRPLAPKFPKTPGIGANWVKSHTPADAKNPLGVTWAFDVAPKSSRESRHELTQVLLPAQQSRFHTRQWMLAFS